MASLPVQVRAAAEAAGATPLDAVEADTVLCCGMGGSAVGGDVLAAVAADAGRAPVSVHRGYGVPAWCGPTTFVIASSYSGNTEETLDAFRAARDAGARGVALTSGGTLAEEAERAGWPVVAVAPGLMPRYAVGWMSVLPSAVSERAGLVRLADGWPTRLPEALAARVARWGPDGIAQDNVAKGLAHALHGASPVVWGGEGASAVAAYRFKCDLNENAKVFAHSASLPEADHNEIVGWASEGREDRPAGRRVLVCLREPDEDPRLAARFDVTTHEVADDFELVWEATAEGEDALERFCDLALLAGFTSVYLAIMRGVDPTPVASIDRLKSRLADA